MHSQQRPLSPTYQGTTPKSSRLYQQLLQNNYLHDTLYSNSDHNPTANAIKFTPSPHPNAQPNYNPASPRLVPSDSAKQQVSGNPFKTFDLHNKSSIQATQSLNSNYCITQNENEENSTVNLYSLSRNQIEMDLELSSNHQTTKLDIEEQPEQPSSQPILPALNEPIEREITPSNPASVKKYRSQEYSKHTSQSSLQSSDNPTPKLLLQKQQRNEAHRKFSNAQDSASGQQEHFKTVMNEIHVVPYKVNEEVKPYAYSLPVDSARSHSHDPSHNRTAQPMKASMGAQVPQMSTNILGLGSLTQRRGSVPDRLVPNTDRKTHSHHQNNKANSMVLQTTHRKDPPPYHTQQSFTLPNRPLYFSNHHPQQQQAANHRHNLTAIQVPQSEMSTHRPTPKSEPKMPHYYSHKQQNQNSQRSHSNGNKHNMSYDHRQKPTRPPNLKEIPLHYSREERHMLEMSKLTQRLGPPPDDAEVLPSESSVIYENNAFSLCCGAIRGQVRNEQPNKINFKPAPPRDEPNRSQNPSDRSNSLLPDPMASLDLHNAISQRPTTAHYKINPIKMIKDHLSQQDERPLKRGLKLVGFPRREDY